MPVPRASRTRLLDASSVDAKTMSITSHMDGIHHGTNQTRGIQGDTESLEYDDLSAAFPRGKPHRQPVGKRNELVRCSRVTGPDAGPAEDGGPSHDPLRRPRSRRLMRAGQKPWPEVYMREIMFSITNLRDQVYQVYPRRF